MILNGDSFGSFKIKKPLTPLPTKVEAQKWVTDHYFSLNSVWFLPHLSTNILIGMLRYLLFYSSGKERIKATSLHLRRADKREIREIVGHFNQGIVKIS